MNRRGLLKRLALGVATLFGYKSVVKAEQQGRWSVDLYAFAENIWKSYGLEVPGPAQTPEKFIESLVECLAAKGTALIWKVPNVLGEVMEVHVLPLERTYSSIEGDLGCYDVVTPRGFPSYSIPAEWVDRYRWPVVDNPLVILRKHIEDMEAIDQTRFRYFQLRALPEQS